MVGQRKGDIIWKRLPADEVYDRATWRVDVCHRTSTPHITKNKMKRKTFKSKKKNIWHHRLNTIPLA